MVLTLAARTTKGHLPHPSQSEVGAATPTARPAVALGFLAGYLLMVIRGRIVETQGAGSMGG